MSRSNLDAIEAERQAIQAAFDRQKSPAERNRLGQFATPADLASEMAALAEHHLPPRESVRFLDPAVGSGVFFHAARKVLGRRLRSGLGFEIDAELAAVTQRLWAEAGLEVRGRDFCAAPPPVTDRERATLVLCNPPYVRHHHLTADQKARLGWEVELLGAHVSGLAGLYCYFLLLAHEWMVPGGLGVWVVPAEFLDVNYGQAVKRYLLTQVTLLRLHRFDPEDVQFADALVSSVVLVFRNAPLPHGHQVQLTSGGRLTAPRVARLASAGELRPEAKWGPLFCEPVDNVRANSGGLAIGNLFSVKRGLATGANNYFILERGKAAALGLPAQFLRPILPSPRYLPGPVIEGEADGFPCDLPQLVLLDCDLLKEQIRNWHPALFSYLKRGEKQGIAKRYLPRHRTPWYKQERRPPAPVLCTYMGRQRGGRAIRFLRNKSGATAPNVYLLLYPKPVLEALLDKQPEMIDRVFAALQDISAALALDGRVYGGGLNKIEPRELASVQLPKWVLPNLGLNLSLS